MYENMGLYRGKQIDNDEWITGYLLSFEDGRARICARHTDIFCYEKDRSIIQTVANEVIPDTVGECTGLKDKNGKLIFDGDIVRCDDLFTAVVKWDSSHARFNLAIIYKAEIDKCVNLTRGKADKLTICCNIHDNPELLKEGADNG